MTPLRAIRVLRSENSKLWSLRSTRFVLAAMVLVPVALALMRVSVAPPARLAAPATGTAAALESIAVSGIPLALLAAALGLIVMGSEFADDVLSTTLAAVPKRQVVLLAKCAVAFASSLAAAAIGLVGASIVSMAVLGERSYENLPVSEMTSICGAGTIAAALAALLGVSAAAAIGSLTSAAIQLTLFLTLVPSVVGFVAGGAGAFIASYLPLVGVQAAVTRYPARPFTIEGAPPSVLPWSDGLLVVVVWAAASVAIALLVSPHAAATRVAKVRRHRPARRLLRDVAPARFTALGLVRSELLKLLTLPAARWLLALLATAIVGFALLSAGMRSVADVNRAPVGPGHPGLIDPAYLWGTIGAGTGMVQLRAATLGAVAITSEFTSGNMRPTLLATPRRLLLLAVKVGVVGAMVGAVAAAAWTFVAFAAVALERSRGFDVTVLDRGLVDTLLRCVVTAILASLIGCAFGIIVRSPLPAIAAVLVVFVVSISTLGPLQQIAAYTPMVWLGNLVIVFPSALSAIEYLPSYVQMSRDIGGGAVQLLPDDAMLVMVGWAVLGIGTSALVFRRRGA